MMFGDVVLEINRNNFEYLLQEKKEEKNVKYDNQLSADDLKELVNLYKAIVKNKKGFDFPEDPQEQLKMAINAVFNSWNNKRAITYRKLNGISGDWGTAVNVQSMVFGNMGDTSATGVAFTRNPSTGEKKFYGEYLINAQGEDVVAGIRTPRPILDLKKEMPEAYDTLKSIYQKLENHYKDMQDIEFTIQDKKLYMLQTRSGKRTAAAAIRTAVEMVKEGLIDKKTALLRVNPEQLDQMMHSYIDPKAELDVLAKGLPASPGAGVGQVVFTAEHAEKLAEQNQDVILVRLETSPEDIGGMNAAQGILTVRGGMTSHAAVVARGMGKCCVAGCGDIKIDDNDKTFTVNGAVVNEGEFITLDGSTGRVIKGKAPMIQHALTGNFLEIMSWADEVRRLKVRANAETAHDASVARKFGAEGIGLCRTEHMFFDKGRIKAVREMILAETEKARKKALDKIIPMQKGDFKEIFKIMSGLPVTIRLLDPPLHEFLPHTKEEIKELARDMCVSEEVLSDKSRSLKEMNPMLGHRGCRLGITYPEIYEMQVRAIIEAAIELTKENVKVIPEIMIPLIGHVNEFTFLNERVKKVAEAVMNEKGNKVEYSVGTMIELPRAALTADKIAMETEFFSFGTNDLTQTSYGFSRDDTGSFMPHYLGKNILEKDPFVSIDEEGVGELIKIGVKKGRKAKSDLKIGICGEHGGEPLSVEFCHRIGLDYVSCSPYRVVIAKLAAAQAVLKCRKSSKHKIRI
jgi:pyruvate,orthophosphate dikinase